MAPSTPGATPTHRPTARLSFSYVTKRRSTKTASQLIDATRPGQTVVTLLVREIVASELKQYHSAMLQHHLEVRQSLSERIPEHEGEVVQRSDTEQRTATTLPGPATLALDKDDAYGPAIVRDYRAQIPETLFAPNWTQELYNTDRSPAAGDSWRPLPNNSQGCFERHLRPATPTSVPVLKETIA
ncbi:hypothetical protein TI39_contig5857g00001 [Zymoseptoria brevis]|uniref:Uncharacterized protein n=1 Tax=Zymoseptoria brevis TaxID=1047168 RepID=A0A0F4G4X8_9PEZI|nr:hypothetical protein TI39_contig5857g00001 [Zymoseptoria brevis]